MEKPLGLGWAEQARRFRLYISLPPDVAVKVGREAERLGVSPSVLASMIISEKMNAKKEEK